MDYLHVPKEISTKDIAARDWSWSPAMHQKVTLPTSAVVRVADLLDPGRPFDRGVEPGSSAYLRESPTSLIRTKALQSDSCLLYPKGDAIVGVNPRVFQDYHLAEGDILMSKDSNIGEAAIIEGSRWRHHMFSGGIVRLNPLCDRYYLLAFLKHPLFRTQLVSMAARGATILHAKRLWLDALIPFPNQPDRDAAVRYVSALMQAIVAKEVAIRYKNRLIDTILGRELEENQRNNAVFAYSHPTSGDLRATLRFDAAVYSRAFKKIRFLIDNYVNGAASYDELGFVAGRGQNLQVSAIGLSAYSGEPLPGTYRLVAPVDMSEYRTVLRFRYLGNSKRLGELKLGDVVFGAEGFWKGRVVIIADEVQKTITNIHGVVFHPSDGDPVKGAFLGCYLGYLRSTGLLDLLAAGGSGGSLGIGYFSAVPIPRFPREKQEEIAKLFHNPVGGYADDVSPRILVERHGVRNETLGIWELDQEMKMLQRRLALVQDRIIQGNPVVVPTAGGVAMRRPPD